MDRDVARGLEGIMRAFHSRRKTAGCGKTALQGRPLPRLPSQRRRSLQSATTTSTSSRHSHHIHRVMFSVPFTIYCAGLRWEEGPVTRSVCGTACLRPAVEQQRQHVVVAELRALPGGHECTVDTCARGARVVHHHKDTAAAS